MKLFTHSILFLFFIGFISFSCKRPNPPKAVILTLDTASKPISNVTVTIYAQPNGSYIDPKGKVMNVVQKTDANGEASFDFKNEAIFNVKAIKTTPVHREANGMIILKEDETTRKTLILR